jgi:CRP/FNR family transcriptional regulator, cyclic AMP receptor protein
MTPVERTEAAQVYQLLSELDPRHILKLLPLAKDAFFGPQQVICRQKAKSENLYLIVKGTVVLEAITTGSPIRIQMLNAGEILGWSALLEAGHARFEARALSEVEAIAFDGSELRKVFGDNPELGYAFMKAIFGVVADRLDATRMHLADS